MGMEKNGVDKPVGVKALEALGKGFDLSSDFWLRFAKGIDGGERLPHLWNQERTIIPRKLPKYRDSTVGSNPQ